MLNCSGLCHVKWDEDLPGYAKKSKQTNIYLHLYIIKTTILSLYSKINKKQDFFKMANHKQETALKTCTGSLIYQ